MISVKGSLYNHNSLSFDYIRKHFEFQEILRSLGVKGHDVCNLLSHSEKMCVYIVCVFIQRKEMGVIEVKGESRQRV